MGVEYIQNSKDGVVSLIVDGTDITKYISDIEVKNSDGFCRITFTGIAMDKEAKVLVKVNE